MYSTYRIFPKKLKLYPSLWWMLLVVLPESTKTTQVPMCNVFYYSAVTARATTDHPEKRSAGIQGHMCSN